MTIYTVWVGCNDYDVNMLVNAENAEQAENFAKEAVSLKIEAKIADDELIKEMQLEDDYKSVQQGGNGAFIIYDEGT
jgi:hypothetical protein